MTILIHDENENAVTNATVNGDWSDGYSASVSCLTNNDGRCIITSPNFNLNKGPLSVLFTLMNVTHNALEYKPGSNHDPVAVNPSVIINAPL